MKFSAVIIALSAVVALAQAQTLSPEGINGATGMAKQQVGEIVNKATGGAASLTKRQVPGLPEIKGLPLPPIQRRDADASANADIDVDISALATIAADLTANVEVNLAASLTAAVKANIKALVNIKASLLADVNAAVSGTKCRQFFVNN